MASGSEPAAVYLGTATAAVLQDYFSVLIVLEIIMLMLQCKLTKVPNLANRNFDFFPCALVRESNDIGPNFTLGLCDINFSF